MLGVFFWLVVLGVGLPTPAARHVKTPHPKDVASAAALLERRAHAVKHAHTHNHTAHNSPAALLEQLPIDSLFELVSSKTHQKTVLPHGMDLEVTNFGGTNLIYPYTQNVYQQLFVHAMMLPQFDEQTDVAVLKSTISKLQPFAYTSAQLEEMGTAMQQNKDRRLLRAANAAASWRANLRLSMLAHSSEVPTHLDGIPIIRPNEEHAREVARQYVTEQHELQLESSISRQHLKSLQPLIDRMPALTQVGRLLRIFQDIAEFREGGPPVQNEAFQVSKNDILNRFKRSLEGLNLETSNDHSLAFVRSQINNINYAWINDDSPPRSWPQNKVAACHFVRHGLAQRGLIPREVQEAARAGWCEGRPTNGGVCDETEMDYGEFAIKICRMIGSKPATETPALMKGLADSISRASAETSTAKAEEEYLQDALWPSTGKCDIEPSVLQVMFNMFELDSFQQGMDEPRSIGYLSTCEWTLAYSFLSNKLREMRVLNTYHHSMDKMFNAWAHFGMHDLESNPVVPDSQGDSNDLALSYKQFRSLLQTVEQGNQLLVDLASLGGSVTRKAGKITAVNEAPKREDGVESFPSTVETDLITQLKARPSVLNNQDVVFDMFKLFDPPQRDMEAGKRPLAEKLFVAMSRAIDLGFIEKCKASIDGDVQLKAVPPSSGSVDLQTLRVTRFDLMAFLVKSDPGITCAIAAKNAKQVWFEAGMSTSDTTSSMTIDQFVDNLVEKPIFLNIPKNDIKHALSQGATRPDARVRYLTADEFVLASVVAAEYQEYSKTNMVFFDLLPTQTTTAKLHDFAEFYKLFLVRYPDTWKAGPHAHTFFKPEHALRMETANWCAAAKMLAVEAPPPQCDSCNIAGTFDKWKSHYGLNIDTEALSRTEVDAKTVKATWEIVAATLCSTPMEAECKSKPGCIHEVCSARVVEQYIDPFLMSFFPEAQPAQKQAAIAAGQTCLCGQTSFLF